MISTIERTETLDAPTKDVLSEIEDNVLGNYTLADALREGALSVKQVQNTFGSMESGTGCALTAIATATMAHDIQI